MHQLLRLWWRKTAVVGEEANFGGEVRDPFAVVSKHSCNSSLGVLILRWSKVHQSSESLWVRFDFSMGYDMAQQGNRGLPLDCFFMIQFHVVLLCHILKLFVVVCKFFESVATSGNVVHKRECCLQIFSLNSIVHQPLKLWDTICDTKRNDCKFI